MSHYARLKVTEDAPAEVIRAAYRVLAAKHHPDRQGTAEGPGAQAHADMSALNTAYQVLINPQTRSEYDRLLAERRKLSKAKPFGRKESVDEIVIQVTQPEPKVTRVDMEWLPPKTEDVQPVWMSSRRVMFMGGSAVGVLVFGMTYWVWQLFIQHQMEKALSEQYAARPAVPVEAVVPVAPAVVMASPLVAAPSAPSQSASGPVMLNLDAAPPEAVVQAP